MLISGIGRRAFWPAERRILYARSKGRRVCGFVDCTGPTTADYSHSTHHGAASGKLLKACNDVGCDNASTVDSTDAVHLPYIASLALAALLDINILCSGKHTLRTVTLCHAELDCACSSVHSMIMKLQIGAPKVSQILLYHCSFA